MRADRTGPAGTRRELIKGEGISGWIREEAPHAASSGWRIVIGNCPRSRAAPQATRRPYDPATHLPLRLARSNAERHPFFLAVLLGLGALAGRGKIRGLEGA